MACCGLHRLKFKELDEETPDFSSELAAYQTGKCQRQVSLRGRPPAKVPLCAEDVEATNDEALFDEKGYLVGLCAGHAAMVVSQAVEGRACTGEACSGLDQESGLSKAKPRCGTKFVGKRLYCDECYGVRISTGVTPAKPVRALVMSDGSLDSLPASASSSVSALSMSGGGSPAMRGGVFGAALSRAGRALAGVGGDAALHDAVASAKAAGSPARSDDATTLPESGGAAAVNLGVELDLASLKELMAASMERQEAMVARQAAENELFRSDLGAVREGLEQVADTLGHFSARLGEAERKASAAPAVLAGGSTSEGPPAAAVKGVESVASARAVGTDVMDELRGPELPDDPTLPPLRRLERAIENAAKSDREVSPSKKELRDKAKSLESEVAEESKRIERLVASDGAQLVRLHGIDGAAERIASSAGVDSLEAIVNLLSVKFPPAFGKVDEAAVELDFDEASGGEDGSEHCSEQSDAEPEPEVVQYLRANGGREAAHLLSEEADGTLLIKLLESGKGRRAPPSRVVRDAKRSAGEDSDGHCSDASEVQLERVLYVRADGSHEPSELIKMYPDGRLRVRMLSSGKEKRVTEDRLVRGEGLQLRGGAAAKSAGSEQRATSRSGGVGARASSAGSFSLASSAAESDFPSLYSQFAGDEISDVSSLSMADADVRGSGRWRSDAAKSYASERIAPGPDNFNTLGRALGSIGGEPSSGVRRRTMDAALRALNDGTAQSFEEAFGMFQEERPDWRRELSEAPPRTAPGAHVMDVSPSEVAAFSARSMSSREGREYPLDADYQGAGRRDVTDEAPGRCRWARSTWMSWSANSLVRSSPLMMMARRRRW